MKLFNSEEKTTNIWRCYEAGREQHRVVGMYKNAERCHRFYEGDQWYGLQSGGEELPQLNFIKPICTYKIATVAMNTTAIIYSSIGTNNEVTGLCEALNRLATALWEKNKMEYKKWDIVKNACITGDAYLYCFEEREPTESLKKELTPHIKTRVIDKTAVYFADEQNPDINEQEWIIISERVPIAKIKKTALKNGISESEIALISENEASESDIGVDSAHEVKSSSGKCTSLLYMRKTNDGIAFCRSVREIVYQPEQVIKGLDIYPLCGMRWLPKMGSARGVGIIESLLPNQIEVNRTIARRTVGIKRNGYTNMVVDMDKIENPEALGKIGSIINVKNLDKNPISSMVQYLTPAPMSNDAAILQNELISTSRELEGASESATGQINPEKTSGEAIKAARDQSAMSLTEQSAAYKQFCEDLALCWYKLWVAYSVHGIEITVENADKKLFSYDDLKSADIDIKIDVSPTDPYSILSREMALENALARGHISFEEYVEILDSSSGVPKDKFKKILQERAEKGISPPQSAQSVDGIPPGAQRAQQVLPQIDAMAGMAQKMPPEVLQLLQLAQSGQLPPEELLRVLNIGGEPNAMP